MQSLMFISCWEEGVGEVQFYVSSPILNFIDGRFKAFNPRVSYFTFFVFAVLN